MAIVQVHTVMVVDVDTETGKVVGPVEDAGTDMLYDGHYIYDPDADGGFGMWGTTRSFGDSEKLRAAEDAACARFKALIDSQGA